MRRQGGIVAQQLAIGVLADENSALARGSFQAAGDVHFPAKHRVVHDVVIGPHEAHCHLSGVDAGAKHQHGQQRLEGPPFAGADQILLVQPPVFRDARGIDARDALLGGNGRANAGNSMALVRQRRSPESHDAITDVFVHSAAVLLHRVGNGSEIDVHRVEGEAGLLIQIGGGGFGG